VLPRTDCLSGNDLNAFAIATSHGASKQYFRIPFDQEVLISIRPKIITTSDGLKHYEPNRRQCYFQKEKELRYFNIYSQSNCELECLANFTLTKCGCVKFSMPRKMVLKNPTGP